MATKKSPIVNVPAKSKAQTTFEALVDLVRNNTQCPTTLAIVESAVANCKPMLGIPGVFEDQPADYSTGIAKVHAASQYAVKGKQMDAEIGRRIAFAAGLEAGPIEAPVRTAEAVIMSSAYRSGRKLASHK